MKFVHHIGIRVTDEVHEEFLRAGVKLRLGEESRWSDSFQIAEDDSRWMEIEALLRKYQISTLDWTEFSPPELEAASFVAVQTSTLLGYPMPDRDGSWRVRVYDGAAACPQCRIGFVQQRPFRIKKAPFWGRKSVFRLNWVYDELFVNPDVYETVFKPLGVDCWPVLLHKTGEELDSVLQLRIDARVELDFAEVDCELCGRCGRKKCLMPSRGFFPRPAATSLVAFKSSQVFGSSGVAERAILFSQQVYRRITEAKAVGFKFSACTK